METNVRIYDSKDINDNICVFVFENNPTEKKQNEFILRGITKIDDTLHINDNLRLL